MRRHQNRPRVGPARSREHRPFRSGVTPLGYGSVSRNDARPGSRGHRTEEPPNYGGNIHGDMGRRAPMLQQGALGLEALMCILYLSIVCVDKLQFMSSYGSINMAASILLIPGPLSSLSLILVWSNSICGTTKCFLDIMTWSI